jgi:tetratricopeptide (TPR) repeat protein
VQLLELPDRKVPSPFPDSGSLSLRRLSDPTTLYEVSWPDVAKVELYEDLIMAEAKQSLDSNELERAYLNLRFLRDNYPQMPGLEDLTERYLQRDAMAAFAEKRFEESLTVLSALHSINPRREGLAKAIEGVTDQVIAELLAKREFRAAREMIDSLGKQFADLNLDNLVTWQQKFASGAERQLATARQAIADGNLALARQSLQRAQTILPDIVGADELYAEIVRLAPQIVVGVSEPFVDQRPSKLPNWSVERDSRLIHPRFVEIVAVGPEGAVYASPWAKVELDVSGLQLQITLSSGALAEGITPDKVALQLLKMANPESDEFRIDFANCFERVEIVGGDQVVLHLKSIHVKPVMLLNFPLSNLDIPPQGYQIAKASEPGSTTFELPFSQSTAPAIVEQVFANDDEAIQALDRGDIDVLDEIAPWQVEKTSQLTGLTVAKYRLPTVHVLLSNSDNPLLRRREYRRALCYGTDRPRMVAEVFGVKDQQSPFRVLSGPLPAGVTFNDPIGFAYKQELSPLPYEPRLAVVLATAARTAVAKEALIAAGEKPDSKAVRELKPGEPEPLILLHPARPLARTMCQLMKRQLDTIGIPVELKQEGDGNPGHWDLKYAELCVWEPLADVRALLGPGGLAGRCSPAMNQLLSKLDSASNWNEVTSRLHQVHQLAFEEMPVIPLWQTQNYFVHRDSVKGIDATPVSLFQSVRQWKLSFARGDDSP